MNDVKVSEGYNSLAALDEALAHMITKAATGLEEAGEFLVDEVPEVIYQLLLWKTTTITVWVVLGILAVALGVYLLWLWVTKVRYNIELAEQGGNYSKLWVVPYRNGYAPTDSMSVISLTASTSLIAIGLAIFFGNISEMLLLYLAPKVWLLEYGAQLVK